MIPIILNAFIAFFFFFFLQIIIARLFRPTSEDKFIILFFVGLPFILFLLLVMNDFWGVTTLNEGLLSYLLFFVVASSWVASYPAIYAVCPTLVMSYVIDVNNGTSAKEIEQLLSLKENSKDRLVDAIHNNWVRMENSKIVLTWSGRAFFYFFATYRRLIGLKLETL